MWTKMTKRLVHTEKRAEFDFLKIILHNRILQFPNPRFLVISCLTILALFCLFIARTFLYLIYKNFVRGLWNMVLFAFRLKLPIDNCFIHLLQTLIIIFNELIYKF